MFYILKPIFTGIKMIYHYFIEPEEVHLIKRHFECTLNCSRGPRHKSLRYINFLSLSFNDSVDSRCNRIETTTNILRLQKWPRTAK